MSINLSYLSSSILSYIISTYLYNGKPRNSICSTYWWRVLQCIANRNSSLIFLLLYLSIASYYIWDGFLTPPGRERYILISLGVEKMQAIVFFFGGGHNHVLNFWHNSDFQKIFSNFFSSGKRVKVVTITKYLKVLKEFFLKY